MDTHPPGGLADRLAEGRSHLANERTLLAYVRTAIALVAAGAALPKLVDTRTGLTVAIWALVSLGAITLVVGIGRFWLVRKQIKEGAVEPPGS